MYSWGGYDVPVGLPNHIGNGNRACLAFEVDSDEIIVSLPTLHTLFGYYISWFIPPELSVDFASLTPSQCKNLYVIIGLIMTLRTWAVWYRNRYLTIILPVLFVIVWAPDLALLPLFLRSLKFPSFSDVQVAVAERPYPEFQGCLVMQADHLLIYVWAIFMIWDAYHTGGNTALLKATYQQLLITVARSIHSMLTSRVVLNIRVYSKANSGWSDGLTDLNSRIDNQHQHDERDAANGLRKMVYIAR
ncbi:hypothetical protein CVT25_014341 [Psilocybe cyanescens]|uniref:Uncharacterized protein n=1 Tax=Psilocybe cyanescens TaxID=93625 RepID=A0A409WU89_PSICY|nr:hypothetical protein CVT25_014341 [Psilocybe cyanescens]